METIPCHLPWAGAYHSSIHTSCWRCGREVYRSWDGTPATCKDCRWYLDQEAKDEQRRATPIE